MGRYEPGNAESEIWSSFLYSVCDLDQELHQPDREPVQNISIFTYKHLACQNSKNSISNDYVKALVSFVVSVIYYKDATYWVPYQPVKMKKGN